jgi:hypothetical protein
MPVNIKTKVATPKQTKTVQKGLGDLNEYLTSQIIEGTHYQAQVSMYETKLKEAKANLETVKSRVLDAVNEADLPSKDTIELNSSDGTVAVGVEADKTIVTDVHGAFERLQSLKPGLAFDLMSFTLGNLKKYLSAVEVEQFTKVQIQHGKRAIKFKPMS